VLVLQIWLEIFPTVFYWSQKWLEIQLYYFGGKSNQIFGLEIWLVISDHVNLCGWKKIPDQHFSYRIKTLKNRLEMNFSTVYYQKTVGNALGNMTFSSSAQSTPQMSNPQSLMSLHSNSNKDE